MNQTELCCRWIELLWKNTCSLQWFCSCSSEFVPLSLAQEATFLFPILSLFLSLLCLNSLLSWFILAIQCARHENLYIYHTLIWTPGHDISKLFFPYTFIILFFFFFSFLKGDTVFFGLKQAELSKLVQHPLLILVHILYFAHGIEQKAEAPLLYGSLPVLWLIVCS